MRLLRTILCGTVLAVAPGVVGQEPDAPADLGLTERAGVQLAQLDVTVTGPPELIEDLRPEDFELRVGGRFVEGFLVDRVCRSFEGSETVARAESRPVADTSDAGEASAPAVIALPPPAPATFVFFFDQPHLTMTGHNRGYEIAEDLITRLFQGNAQGMIVSNARQLKTVTDMTTDREVLLAGLARLKQDRGQWDTFAQEEDYRVNEVLQALEADIDLGIAAARRWQREEEWRARNSLNRLSMVLGRIAENEPPKALLYFADTMRSNAGEHFLSFFSAGIVSEQARLSASVIEGDAFMAENYLEKVHNEASAMGVRFYTIEAQGLVSATTTWGASSARIMGGSSATKTGDPTAGNTVRIRDAQNTLAAMALESGGRAFIHNEPPKKMARQIVEDLSCLYLISFDPAGFKLNTPLQVNLIAKPAKVRVQTRGRLVIQSEKARKTAELLASFATAASTDAAHPIDYRVIPTGFADGKYSALVQVTVPPTQVVNATWDLGASLVTLGKVRSDASGRVRTATPGVRVIFEQVMSFPPGKYELVAVAHEITTDQVLTRRFEGDWPDPNDAPVTLGPIAVMQPEIGAFLRGERLKKQGPLAVSDDEPVVFTDRPTAIVGLVCRAKNNKNKLRVERTLEGDSSAEFGLLELDADGDRCVPFGDTMPSNTMTDGGFRYVVRVVEKGEEIATSTTEFQAVAPKGS